MAREMINESELENVVGGSIVFNADYTTCGHNCNNQYQVLDKGSVLKYIGENCTKMSERTMLRNMVAAGLLVAI